MRAREVVEVVVTVSTLWLAFEYERVGIRGQMHPRLVSEHEGGGEGGEGLHLAFGRERGQSIRKQVRKTKRKKERRGAPDTSPIFHPIWPPSVYPSHPSPFPLAFTASTFDILLVAVATFVVVVIAGGRT
jgi:hypothetical protein